MGEGVELCQPAVKKNRAAGKTPHDSSMEESYYFLIAKANQVNGARDDCAPPPCFLWSCQILKLVSKKVLCKSERNKEAHKIERNVRREYP